MTTKPPSRGPDWLFCSATWFLLALLMIGAAVVADFLDRMPKH